MTIETREYAQGTSVTQEHPWGFYIRARVMCPDGIVRATSKLRHDHRTLHPDTRNETWVDMVTALAVGVILAGVLYACFIIGQGNIRANTTDPTTQTDTATTQEITQP